MKFDRGRGGRRAMRESGVAIFTLLALAGGLLAVLLEGDIRVLPLCVPLAVSYYAIARGRTWGAFSLLASSVGVALAAASGAVPAETFLLAAGGAISFVLLLPVLLRFDAVATGVATVLTLLVGSVAAVAFVGALSLASGGEEQRAEPLANSCISAANATCEVRSRDGRLHWLARAHVAEDLDLDGQRTPVLLVPEAEGRQWLHGFSWKLYLRHGGCMRYVGKLPSAVEPYPGDSWSNGLRDLVVLRTLWPTSDAPPQPVLVRYTFDGRRYVTD